MTPRERVECVLDGKRADRVPFTMYENMIPQCAAEREMRNRGLCIVHRINVYQVRRPNVKATQQTCSEGGRRLVRTVYETPAGTLAELREPAGFTSWKKEYLFKGPKDYAALRFLFSDEEYQPRYEHFSAVQHRLGGDALCRSGMGYEPLQMLISGGVMDMQDFCIEWMDRRDEILKLYDILVENERRVYPILAESPAKIVNCGGNVVPEITGPKMYRQYYLPHYHEAAELLHQHGKLIGCHLDANCRALAECIAESELDYIEAFTPSPDTDMTLAEARAAWPDKILWVNFPSSLHLKSDAEITRTTEQMLESLAKPDGIIMGITEDIPEHRWRDSCRAIMAGLEQHAAGNPDLYGG